MIIKNITRRLLGCIVVVCSLLLFWHVYAENPIPAQNPVINASVEEQHVIIEEFKKNCENLQKKIDALESCLRSEEFIEQRISLAELNELINKIEEDLSARISLLDRSDKADVIKILKEKERALLKYLQDIEAFSNPDFYKKKHKKKRYVVAVSLMGIALIAALTGAAYDPDCGSFDWPTLGRLNDNSLRLWHIVYAWWQSFDKKAADQSVQTESAAVVGQVVEPEVELGHAHSPVVDAEVVGSTVSVHSLEVVVPDRTVRAASDSPEHIDSSRGTGSDSVAHDESSSKSACSEVGSDVVDQAVMPVPPVEVEAGDTSAVDHQDAEPEVTSMHISPAVPAQSGWHWWNPGSWF